MVVLKLVLKEEDLERELTLRNDEIQGDLKLLCLKVYADRSDDAFVEASCNGTLTRHRRLRAALDGDTPFLKFLKKRFPRTLSVEGELWMAAGVCFGGLYAALFGAEPDVTYTEWKRRKEQRRLIKDRVCEKMVVSRRLRSN